jgi:tetratricopeptide (TPR) repeat protein
MEADRFENWADWRILNSHAEALSEELEDCPREYWNYEILHARALYCLGQERNFQGELLQRRAYELMAERLGEGRPDTLQAKNDLALLLNDKQEACRLLRECMEGLENTYHADNDPKTEIILLACMFNLSLYLGPGPQAASESETLLRVCVDRFAASPRAGESHWRTLLSSRRLADCLYRAGKREEANALALKTLARSERSPVLGSNHKDTLDFVDQVAEFLLGDGKTHEAEPYLRRSLVGREQAADLGPQHSATLMSFQLLLNSLCALSRFADAEELCQSRRRAWTNAIGAEHPHTLECIGSLAGVLTLNGKFSEARQVEVELALSQARNLYYNLQAQVGREDDQLLAAMQGLADSLAANGELKEAEITYRRCLDAYRRAKGGDDEETAVILNNYGLLLRDAGQLEESLRRYQAALEINEKLSLPTDPKHPIIPHRLTNVALVLLMQGRASEAKPYLTRAWHLKHDAHYATSARILWVRLAVALLTGEPASQFVGQLKATLPESPHLSIPANIDNFWNVQSVIEKLREQLPNQQSDLLALIVNRLNAFFHFHANSDAGVGGTGNGGIKMEDFALWKNQPAIPLDVPWQPLT